MCLPICKNTFLVMELLQILHGLGGRAGLPGAVSVLPGPLPPYFCSSPYFCSRNPVDVTFHKEDPGGCGGLRGLTAFRSFCLFFIYFTLSMRRSSVLIFHLREISHCLEENVTAKTHQVPLRCLVKCLAFWEGGETPLPPTHVHLPEPVPYLSWPQVDTCGEKVRPDWGLGQRSTSPR